MEGTQQNENNERGRNHEEAPEKFAARRAKVVDDALANLLAKAEDIVNMQGETGSHVANTLERVIEIEKRTVSPSAAELAKMNIFARTVHKIDGVLSSAGPYLRAGAAIVATGGAVYGGVKGAQATYRWITAPKPDAKAMPVGEPFAAT